MVARRPLHRSGITHDGNGHTVGPYFEHPYDGFMVVNEAEQHGLSISCTLLILVFFTAYFLLMFPGSAGRARANRGRMLILTQLEPAKLCEGIRNCRRQVGSRLLDRRSA